MKQLTTKTKQLFFTTLLILTISLSAQVGIGTVNPDPAALLDVASTDKGVLIPRVSLSDVATTSLDGTNNAIESLLIYNTNANVTGGTGIGYYFFNGTTWEALQNKTNAPTHKSLVKEPDTDLSGVVVLSGTNLPLSIPDNETDHALVNLVVSNLEETTVSKITLTLDIDHGYDEDLELFLTSPTGKVLEISTDNGGSSNDYKITTFTDDSPTNITDGSAPFNGSFKPEGGTSTSSGGKTGTINAFSGFYTDAPNGTWSLDVYDDDGISSGTINTVILTISTIATDWFLVDEIAITHKEGYAITINSKYSADPQTDGGVITALTRSAASVGTPGTQASNLSNPLDYSSASPYYGTKPDTATSNYWVTTTNMCYDDALTDGTTYYYQLWRKGNIEPSDENYTLIPMQIKK